jgi:predicted solute-binding protein
LVFRIVGFFVFMVPSGNSILYIRNMPAVKTIGIPPDQFYQPFHDGVRQESRFSVVVKPPPVLAELLDTRTLDVAFVSMLDFARGASEYRVVPGAAVASNEGNNAIVIHFRKGAQNVSTLAVPAVSTSDIVLAKILLAEKFDLEPRIIPVAGTLEEMLRRADAALLSGDDALRADASRSNALDLVEEWVAATDLPYVHGLCVGREAMLSRDDWEKIAAAPAALKPGDALPFGSLTYDTTDQVRNGIREFLQYAYYHGILPDVPDLRFYGQDEPVNPELN